MKTIEKLEQLFSKMSEAEQEYCIQNQLPYILTKAELFLKIGADNYRKEDFFHEPSARADAEDLEAIRLGCEQIMEGRGFSDDKPLLNLGVSGFYRLMELFHFDYESRKTKYALHVDEQKGALDIITFTHRMDDRKTTLFNFCAMPDKE